VDGINGTMDDDGFSWTGQESNAASTPMSLRRNQSLLESFSTAKKTTKNYKNNFNKSNSSWMNFKGAKIILL
jgi:hypothetical protein